MPHNATENTSALMKAVTGLDITPDEVQAVGDRVNTLAKASTRATASRGPTTRCRAA